MAAAASRPRVHRMSIDPSHPVQQRPREATAQ
jgi:hypothetical protein